MENWYVCIYNYDKNCLFSKEDALQRLALDVSSSKIFMQGFGLKVLH